MTEEAETPQRGFFADLIHRRVPQFLGAYILGSIAVLEGVSWVQEQYLLSNHVNHLAGVLILSLVPTILVLAYEHGAPGRQAWTRSSQMLLGICLLVPVLSVGDQLRAGDLEKVTETVEVENEEGVTEKREVPKAQYFQDLAIFPIDNATGEESKNWLSYGIPSMIHFDLFQDSFVNCYSWQFNKPSFWKAEEKGFGPAEKIPLGLQREIARDAGLDHFLSGKLTTEAGGLTLNMDVYQTSTGKKLQSRKFQETGLDALVDKATAQIKKDIGLPEVNLDGVVDLPIGEITTNNPEAQENMWSGLYLLAQKSDWAGGMAKLEQAIVLDPTFALAHLQLVNFYLFSNQIEKMRESVINAKNNQYRLPERLAFAVNYAYIEQIDKDPERAFAVLERWGKLYPRDLMARQMLLLVYQVQNRPDEAVEQARAMLAIDPNNRETHLTLITLLNAKGDRDDALQEVEKYIAKSPKDIRGHTLAGDLLVSRGDFDKADEAYARAMEIDPTSFNLLIKRAEIATKRGNRPEAEALYARAVESARTDQNKTSVYDAFASFHLRHGKVPEAIEQIDAKLAVMESGPPFLYIVESVDKVSFLIDSGSPTSAELLINDLEQQLAGSPYNGSIHLARIYLATHRENEEALETLLGKLDTFIRDNQFNVLRPAYYKAQGDLESLKGNDAAALVAYRKYLDNRPGSTRAMRLVASTLRRLSQNQQAEETLQRALVIDPFNPKANYEAALLYRALGDMTRARKHLDTALETWKDADENYRPAAIARQTRESWDIGI